MFSAALSLNNFKARAEDSLKERIRNNEDRVKLLQELSRYEER